MQRDVTGRLQGQWGEGSVRAFLSHTSKHKTEVATLQAHLKGYGIASFVSHEDIEPLKDWQTEILHALRSAHILIAFLTDDFRSSQWTDQEVGAAIGREIPVIPIRLGSDPHGFIGRYQALSGTFAVTPKGNGIMRLARDIFEIVLRDESIGDLAKDAYVLAVTKAGNFDRANYLAKLMPQFDNLSSMQAMGLVDAFNKNNQVHGSFEFQDKIIPELTRVTGYEYEMETDDKGRLVLRSRGLEIDHYFKPL